MECGFNIEMFPFADNKLAYTTMTVLHTILNNKLFFCNPLSVENPKKLNNKQTKNPPKKKKNSNKNKTKRESIFIMF